jgi:copper(I)-binding protein
MTILQSGLLKRALVAFIAAGCAVAAGNTQAQLVAVSDAWVRAPAPGQRVAGAYMELVSRAPMTLIAAASPAAARVELHSTSMEGGVMRMRPVARIELPAGQAVRLAPGGLHLMLLDLKQPLKAGDRVTLTLTVQGADGARRSVLTVEAEVRGSAAGMSHGH